jgi:hypothetical protein
MDLEKILSEHGAWLMGMPVGKRANLSGAALRYAVLDGANLRNADLSGANLLWARLSKANLSKASLSFADLRWANLGDTNLSGADLRGADLGAANLSGADLRGADLGRADLRGANLSGADLRRADLRGASLGGADLHGAVLRVADLREVKWDYSTLGMAPAPEGTLIVWGKKSGRIVQMRVDEDVPRSCATGRKFRSASAFVLEINDGDVEVFLHCSKYGPPVKYAVGEVVHADGWDPDRWNECSNGIHWLLSRHEAEQWNE